MTVDSPCISVCHIDPETETCVGCGRTLDEIRAWKTADDTQKIDILIEINQRSSERK